MAYKKYVPHPDGTQKSSQASARRATHAEMSSYERAPEFAEGHDPMVGRHDFAGLPQEKIMKNYPKSTRLTRDERLDDTMSEIDDVDERAEMKRQRYLSNQH